MDPEDLRPEPPISQASGTLPAMSSPALSDAQATGPSVEALRPGDRIGDFDILGELGRGAFGVVYLARQVSLDRQVALKVADALGQEGRHLAQLEHEHIVQVFSESTDPSGRHRLLCMQYVPGPTLESVLRRLRGVDRRQWSGETLLAIVDVLTPYPASFDPAGLPNRELLRRSDWTETVCWLGARLAEALDHAHRHRVLHRDVKPANILVSQYGRPMLVDFNLSFRPLDALPSPAAPFGGTLAYMAPEHLDAFNPKESIGPEAVREAADIYGLGVVLYELLTGQKPFDGAAPGAGPGEILARMAAQRRAAVPALPPGCGRAMSYAIGRCLHPDPARRFASAAATATALDGCRDFHAAQKALPAQGRFWRPLGRRPFAWLVLLGLLPNLAASAVQISYNQVRIINHLTAAQQAAFTWLLAYNAVVYPIALGVVLKAMAPVWRVWRDARASPHVDPRRMDAARRRALALPALAAWIAGLGWTSGGLVFTLGLEALAGPVAWEVHAHLATSFAISGLIALVYSFLLVECLVVCVFYRRLWSDVRDFRARATAELEPAPRRVRVFQVLSGLIPLAGAVLMVGIGPQEFSESEYRSFRFLVTALIGLGMAGFQLATSIAGLLSRAIGTLGGRAP